MTDFALRRQVSRFPTRSCRTFPPAAPQAPQRPVLQSLWALERLLGNFGATLAVCRRGGSREPLFATRPRRGRTKGCPRHPRVSLYLRRVMPPEADSTNSRQVARVAGTFARRQADSLLLDSASSDHLALHCRDSEGEENRSRMAARLPVHRRRRRPCPGGAKPQGRISRDAVPQFARTYRFKLGEVQHQLPDPLDGARVRPRQLDHSLHRRDGRRPL